MKKTRNPRKVMPKAIDGGKTRKFGGDTANSFLLLPMDNTRLPFNYNAFPPMQSDGLFGSNGNTMNLVGNYNAPLMNPPLKLRTVGPTFGQNKLPVALNDSIVQNGGEQPRRMWKHIPVSTGLQLSNGDGKHNSSISSANESVMFNMSSVLSHTDNLQNELVRQSNELDQYFRIQEANIRKGIIELQNRHTMSLLNALEKELDCKMREKDAEIENLNLNNKCLVDKIRQLATEAQSWHFRAKQNESLMNSLRTNINEIFQQQAALDTEGYADNMVDDAASSCNQNHIGPNTNVGIPSSESTREPVICKGCKNREVCARLLPCRHLCLCTDCEIFIEICPVCQVKKAGSMQVYMS